MTQEAPPKPTLDYPFAAAPERGQTLEVGPGVRWIRMPLPFRLNHINLWALDDGEGWVLVDTGLRDDETVAVWRELFANAPGPRQLNKVIVTHMHPDHVGMAGWLTRKLGAKLYMSRLEYLTCRVLANDSGREAPPEAVRFYKEAGWSENAVESYRARFGKFGNAIHTLPDTFERLTDGMELSIGGNTWRVVMGNGHSPEHACLYCPALKLFISGDQVLPKISSNVSVTPTEPNANPMADWYASLAKIKREVPDDVLVLPAHNDVFRGLHARLDYLRDSQQHADAKLLARLAQPRRAVDVFEALFGRDITESSMAQLSMATGEGLACLNHLLHKGQISKRLDADGVAWYEAAPRLDNNSNRRQT